MVDKVRHLKIENLSQGSDDDQGFPTETDPSEDYASVKGVVFEDNDNRKVDLNVNGEIQVQDSFFSTPKSIRSIHEVTIDQKEPTGIILRSQSTIVFDVGTRTFSITPVSSSFDYYIKGTKYTISSAKTLQIPDTSGLYFLYLNTSGTLAYVTTFDTSILSDYAYVTALIWDATNQLLTYFGEERHGITMDHATHAYLHTTRGTQLVSGGNIDYTLGDGSSNTHAQIGLGDSVISDEDIRMNITHNSSPSAQFEQILYPIAEIPIVYLTGSIWSILTATQYPIKFGTNRAQYNFFNGSSWSLVDASTNNYYLITYIFATNDVRNPIIGILGRDEYANEVDAINASIDDLINSTGIPIQEFKLLYKIVYQTSSALTNAVKSKITTVTDYRFAFDKGISAISSVTAHSALSGLGADDHVQYLLASGARAMSGNLDMNSNDITNTGTVNGVTVQTHASRHLPSGADPIATASAVTLDASSINATGNAESFARSNHTHEITKGTPVSLGANSTNAEGNSAGLARANHTHALNTGNVSTQNADQANSAGTSDNLARADHIHNIPTATPVSTGSANAQGTANTFAKSDHVHEAMLNYDSAIATANTTTTSSTYTLMNSMTLTPIAGTYIVLFGTTVQSNTNNAEVAIAIFGGGAIVSGSYRGVVPKNNNNDNAGNGRNTSTTAVVTVDGSQAIETRWSITSGTATARERSMSIIRIG